MLLIRLILKTNHLWGIKPYKTNVTGHFMGFFSLATGFRGFCQPINHEVWVDQLSLCHETCSSWSLDLIQGREQQQIQGLLTCLGGRCFTITNWWSKRDGMNSLVIAWNGNVQPFQHQTDLTSITNLLGRYLFLQLENSSLQELRKLGS